MITYNYFGNEQKIFYEKLDNGLDVYIVPNHQHKSYHVELVTRYGSDIKEFIPIKEEKYLKIPDGTAHFLEHKVFDMELSDAFSFFSKYGTYVNAGTNYYCTRYYIDGKKSFRKNLDYLLTMVYTPYFLVESINNEKKIIAEEIKMYDDEVEWILDYETRKCLFKNIFKDKIAGTVNSIQKINANILQKVYDTFYQPSNMFLVVSGNVNCDEVYDILKNNYALSQRDTNLPIVFKQRKEKKEVLLEYKLIKNNVLVPKLRYSYKFDLSDLKMFDLTKTRMYLNILFSILFGNGSSFNEEIISKNISSSFYYEHFCYDNIYLLTFNADSEYADLFVSKVEETLKNMLITEKDFIRIKKVWYSAIIRSIDSMASLADSLTEDILKKEKEFDGYKLINDLSFDELEQVLKRININNHSLVLMVPEE